VEVKLFIINLGLGRSSMVNSHLAVFFFWGKNPSNTLIERWQGPGNRLHLVGKRKKNQYLLGVELRSPSP
jgi:hypothetical protein